MKKIFWFSLFLFFAFLVGSGWQVASVRANCEYPLEICDMPPGECGGTCMMYKDTSLAEGIGPTQCVIDSGDFTRVATGRYEYDCVCEGRRTANEHCQSCDLGGDAGLINACIDTTGNGCGIEGGGPYGGWSNICDCTEGDPIYTYTYCEDTEWNNCCSPPEAPGYCGDGVCDDDESCNTCEEDCGACEDDPITADIQVNGLDINQTLSEPYTVSWASANADFCTINDSSVLLNGSQDYNDLTAGIYLYDLYCENNMGDTAEDSITVTVDCGTISADVKANGSDADIMTYEDYTISWTSSDADDCTLNGGVVALSGSQDELATTEGDYTYNLSCDNFCGDTASDEVTVTVDFCGNGACDGFENCANCEADCGECPNAWWQVWGGSLLSGATGSTAINSPVLGDRSEFVCFPLMIK